MKGADMKKAMLGFIAAAMSLMATTVQAREGDIRSINPCDQYGYVIENGSISQPFSAGETVYFRIRLENENSRYCYENKVSNPWRLEYTGSMDPGIAAAMNPPKVGVFISGQLRGATVVLVENPEEKGWFTDLVCSYTVQPGDIALPMTLADRSGKEIASGDSPEYYLDTLPRTWSWQLVADERDDSNNVVGTVTNSFKYGTTSVFNVEPRNSEANDWVFDGDLKRAGLYIKTIDFAAAEYSVPEGRVEKIDIDVVGGVNTNGNGTVYAMVKKTDDSAVELAEDSVSEVEVEEIEVLGDGSQNTVSSTYQVAKITIPNNAESFSFKVRGLREGGSNTVYISSTKSFTYGFAGDLGTNFITALVRCVAPPPPFIAVTLDGEEEKTVDSSPNYAEYAAKLTVTLSEPHTSDVEVTVTPSLLSGSTNAPLGRYIGMSTINSKTAFSEKVNTVKFTAAEMASGMLSKDLYVYVIGADSETVNGVKFSAENVAIYQNANQPAILYINKCKPQIKYPTEKLEISGVPGGVPYAFTLKIEDDYTNMRQPYTVEWYKTGSGDPQKFTVKPDPNTGEATVSVKYNASGTDADGNLKPYTTRIRVKNAAGEYSSDENGEYRTIYVTVNPAKQVSAIVEDPDDSGEYNETEEELTVRFKLTEAYEDATLYAFLVPMDAASSNLVVCKAFNTGVAIKSGDTESTGTAKIQLLDGTDETLPLSYTIVLRTGKTWNSGDVIGTYESKDLELYINNVAPAVAAVNMSGSAPVTVNGGKFGGKASMGLNKIFTLEADDVDADLEGAVTSEWVFSDPNGNAITKKVSGALDDIVLTNVFEVAGVYTCTVKLQDKDMSSKKWGEVFTFKVEVLNTPSLSIAFPDSNTFNETDADKGLSYFHIDLSTPATKPLEVELVCERVGGNGVLNITTNRVAFRASQMRQQVLISELDGTANSVSFKGGFSVTARVITETLNEDGIAYKDIYLPATEKIYVANEAPSIVLPVDTGITNSAAINVPIPLKWKVDDVDFDLTNNLSVVWTTSEGKREEFRGNDVREGVFTNSFRTGGSKTVTMTVTDKDDGISSITLYYYVSPSKCVNVLPFGPYMNGANTEISKKYYSATGIGEGRVEGGDSAVIEYFAHKYSYGFTDTVAPLKAWGYKNGEVDNRINSSGNLFKTGDTAYTYSDAQGRDSFFYAWVIASKDEEATTYTGTPLISPLPPSARNGFASYTLSLPIEQAGDDNNPVFPDSLVEVFFSKELHSADNMGDMNADGIPDYFAMLNWSMDSGESMSIAEAMTGVAIAGGGGDEGESQASASDLADVSAYNGDLDFLPAAWSSANPLDPGEKYWGPGLPFTAYDEIRGVGKGLNHHGVSEYDLTEAEKFALLADYAAATGKSLSGSQDENYAAATNWAAGAGWTPEAIDPLTGARLNPLKADTDNDGFDDGWEYFFWYYAKVGAVVDKKWSRLEGRRFVSPGNMERISPEEIVKTFNPLQKRSASGDTDNDGLTDFEEYILGTNPVCCDTDGDGVIDLYKVMNGIDPAFDLDNKGNPDCDFMARCDYSNDTFTVYTFANGEIYALPTKSGAAPVLMPFGGTSDVYKVEFASGTVAWFANPPATIPGLDSKTALLAADSTGYSSFKDGDQEFLGKEKVVFGVGSEVKSIATNTVSLTQASVAGFTWSDPVTQLSGETKFALPLFNYGGDGTTYVPCAPSVADYAAVPEDSALVKVETKKKVTLIHNQVFVEHGFHPGTAWGKDGGRRIGAANSAPYTTRDEFFVMQYRQQMRMIDASGKRLADKSFLEKSDKYLVKDGKMVPDVDTLKAATTYPNLPVSFVRSAYASRSEVSPFENSTNKTVVSYWAYLEAEHNVHGADTDFDGIPDGWELYVGSSPNDDSSDIKDADDLKLADEYAGVDSCGAYATRYASGDESKVEWPGADTIAGNNPGKKKGWWNKFCPTNPLDSDTDGDGLQDDAEGAKEWPGEFFVENNWYGSVPMTFIYADETMAEKYEGDKKTTCFRGGGLNPCTVDTDGDLLPDAWEFQYAGIVFKDRTTTIPLMDADLRAITVADGKQLSINATNTPNIVIRGGMDGTFGGDADYDFDHDGLANCQEYLVQALRHLRYDDSLTPLMGMDPTTFRFIRFMPFSSWDGEAFHKRCLEAGFTGLAAWKFSELGYFTLPPRKWDPLRFNKTGLAMCANYVDSEGAGYRVMLPPTAFIDGGSTFELYVNGGKQYASTDPRHADSDYDGMDDYWELFHGLNPILGSYADPEASGEYGWINSQYDRIAEIFGGNVTSWCNHWTGYSSTQPSLDPVRHPWMMGVMEADADGDGLRNDEEALKVNLASPRNTHTDPTPLWMTDSSGKASYTAQYYSPDPYISDFTGDATDTYPDLLRYPWKDITVNIRLAADGMGGNSIDWMFAFEENEGYDTDHDFRRDTTELTRGVEVASDPLNHTDLDRRQALYFPGWDAGRDAGSAAISYGGEFRRSPSTDPELLRQFTVECWVKPDGTQSNVTVLERVCDYGGSTLSLGDSVIRANFRIGIDGNGRVYGELQGSTADSSTARVTAPAPLAVGEWTHVAFRYDGKDAHLHINGAVSPIASATGVGILPANGIDGIQQVPDQTSTSVIPLTGYRALPCATVLGASVKSSSGFGVDEDTTWDDFGGYYKGWIDEVRIWDGARTAAQVHEAFNKRFTMDDIKKLRSNEDKTGVFDMWIAGADRSGTRGLTLPPELLQHYSFSTLPGAVEMDNVITEPTGFSEAVIGNVRKDPDDEDSTLDLHTKVGWWDSAPVHSLVYWDYHVVPWLANTVAHLPYLDGSSADSQFWSSGIAGVSPATSMGVNSYEFPNSANPYPYHFYRRDRYNRMRLLGISENLDIDGTNVVVKVTENSLYSRWLFELRRGFVGTSDLVPLGLAYAKRDSDYWDGQGAMDAWTDTKSSAFDSSDSDRDGIPDWAERLGLATVEDYLRAIAAGLLPDATSKEQLTEAYKSAVDSNFDGLTDWWQKLYGLAGLAQDDTDKDGLADFAEYLVSEIFGFGDISPIHPKSDGNELDYFRKAGRLYLGEMFSDHDFMEDHLEREYAEIKATPAKYDAHIDGDEDGWSNWAEVRAKYDMGMSVNETGAVKTNIVYSTYNYYSDYKSELEYMLERNSEYRIIETDFNIVSTQIRNDDEGNMEEVDWGNGFIKYERYKPVYANSYAYSGVPYPQVEMTVRYNGTASLADAPLTVQAYSDETLREADATFTIANGYNRNVNTLTFKYPEHGYLREGKNTFVVSVGAVSNDTATVGAIMGVARNVDVGWSKVKFDVELTETTPICQRTSLPEGYTNDTAKVYVYRYSIDDVVTPLQSLDLGPVAVRDVGSRKYLHEGDFVSDGEFDLDWAGFQEKVMGHYIVGEGLPVRKVVYRAYMQTVDVRYEIDITNTNKLPFVEIVREFGDIRANAVPVAPGEDSTIYFGGQPTFRWKIEGDRPDTYTAFAIKVTDESGEVWNSGIRMLPPRNANGEYVWMAPLYAGDQTSLGKVFGSCANYKWSVTVYNSKFRSDSWSDGRNFRVNIHGENEPNNAGYHSLDVDVKYFGPAVFDAVVGNASGKIRVEAFTSPDFSGEPAGRVFVTDIVSVTNSVHAKNVRISGLASGTYYVRAYIDSDGDFKRSSWESWGYACQRGDTEKGAIYAPTGFSVGEGAATSLASLYIEDCDVDQDALPDAWEYDEADGSDGFLLKKGPAENKEDGYIAVNPELAANIARVAASNAASSMMSLAASGYMSSAMASLMLGVDSVEPEIEDGTLGITAFSLDGDTVKLTVGAKADDPLAGSVFVSNGQVTAKVVVLHATALSDGFAAIKTVDVTFDIEEGAVSHTECISLRDILGENVDLSKGFFKVELK